VVSQAELFEILFQGNPDLAFPGQEPTYNPSAWHKVIASSGCTPRCFRCDKLAPSKTVGHNSFARRTPTSKRLATEKAGIAELF
jgi:hypothetical protein